MPVGDARHRDSGRRLPISVELNLVKEQWPVGLDMVRSRPLPLHYKGCGGWRERLGHYALAAGATRCCRLWDSGSLSHPGYLLRHGLVTSSMGSTILQAPTLERRPSRYTSWGLAGEATRPLITGQLLFIPEVPCGLSQKAKSDQNVPPPPLRKWRVTWIPGVLSAALAARSALGSMVCGLPPASSFRPF